MRRLRTAIFGLICLALFFGCSHTSKIHLLKVKDRKVIFKWDAVTAYVNGKPIPNKDGKVMYVVYIYNQNRDEKPPEINTNEYDEHKDGLDEKQPIDATSCEVRFKHKGRYFLGVQARLYKVYIEGKPIGLPITKSMISWSSSKIQTNGNPVALKVEK